jgi:hypothetical protein
MKTIITNIKTLVHLLMFMLSIMPSFNDAEASSCIELWPVSDLPVSVRMATSDNLIAIGFPNDGKVMLFELTGEKELKLKHVVVPPGGSLFSSNHKGFGQSIAISGDWVVIGAYRIATSVPQERSKALEYPKGVFITTEVFLLDVRNGKIETLAVGNQKQAIGYSVAAAGDTVAWSVFEKPAPSDIPLSLFHATSGGVIVKDMKSGECRIVKGPSNVRGFGFTLASAPDGYLILSPFDKLPKVFKLIISEGDSSVSSVVELKCPLLVNLFATNSYTAISTGNLWSASEATTIVLPKNSESLSLSHGGCLSGSDNLLAVVQPAMPEGESVPVLYLYRCMKNSNIKLTDVKKGVFAASVIGGSVITVGKSSSGSLRLCVD